MKTARLFALIIGLMPIVAAAQAKSKPIVFTHVTVIDATGAVDAQSDMVVVVADGKVADIGKFGKVKIPKRSQVVDASGKFLIPGLWDCPFTCESGRKLCRVLSSTCHESAIWAATIAVFQGEIIRRRTRLSPASRLPARCRKPEKVARLNGRNRRPVILRIAGTPKKRHGRSR